VSDYLGLQGQRALVTGGTKGVDAAVVAALREADTTVLIAVLASFRAASVTVPNTSSTAGRCRPHGRAIRLNEPAP
jgi:NAD(P)-dependent dehydrogenase (short-subunit alcohol dehydrogenase family)